MKYFSEIKAEADAVNRKLNVVVTGGSFIALEVVCYFADLEVCINILFVILKKFKQMLQTWFTKNLLNF